MIPAVMPTYARADVAFERGEGAYLFDTEGRRYLDFASGIAVTSLGHGHPHLVAALVGQAQLVWHTSNLFRVTGQEKLASRLVANSFADTVFFTNSGVEAWECGVKVARKYHSHNGNPKRWRVITVGGAFHGRTLAAIAAAKTEKLVAGFGPMADGFDQVAFGNLNELRMAVTDLCVMRPSRMAGMSGTSRRRCRASQIRSSLHCAASSSGAHCRYSRVICGVRMLSIAKPSSWQPQVISCVGAGASARMPSQPKA